MELLLIIAVGVSVFLICLVHYSGLFDSARFGGRTKILMKDAYLVFDGNTLLGELSDPVMEDMFWYSWTLTPRIDTARERELLYQADRWSSDPEGLRFVEKASGLRVCFQLGAQHAADETLADDGLVADPALLLENRPARITLRGPYECPDAPAAGA